MFGIQFYSENLSPKINVCKENWSGKVFNPMAKSYFTSGDV